MVTGKVAPLARLTPAPEYSSGAEEIYGTPADSRPELRRRPGNEASRFRPTAYSSAAAAGSAFLAGDAFFGAAFFFGAVSRRAAAADFAAAGFAFATLTASLRRFVSAFRRLRLISLLCCLPMMNEKSSD